MFQNPYQNAIRLAIVVFPAPILPERPMTILGVISTLLWLLGRWYDGGDVAFCKDATF